MERWARFTAFVYASGAPLRRHGAAPGAPPLRRVLWRLLVLIYPVTWATWWTVDFLYNATHSVYLPTCTPYGMMRMRRATYRGWPLRLRDGTTLCYGDPILELHINSPAARDLQRRGINPYRAAAADIACLAYWLCNVDVPHVAVRGRNIIRSFMRQLGAEILAAPAGSRTWFEQLFEEMAILIFHPLGLKRLRRAYAPITDAWYSSAEFAAAADRGRGDPAPAAWPGPAPS